MDLIMKMSRRTEQSINKHVDRIRKARGLPPIVRPNYIHELPLDITKNILSFYTKEEIEESKIPKVIISKDNMETYINEPDVSSSIKKNIIFDPTVSSNVRKIGFKKQNPILMFYALRQKDITFSTEEINQALQHEDKGIVGTAIENTSITLSKEQVQEQWNKDDPFIKAMIVKSGRADLIGVSDEDKIFYNPNDRSVTEARNWDDYDFIILQNSDEINIERHIRMASDDNDLILPTNNRRIFRSTPVQEERLSIFNSTMTF